MALFCYRWGNCDISWDLANWTWSECQLVEDIIQGFGSSAKPFLPDWLNTPAEENEKKKRFIRLLCKIKDGSRYDETKEVKTDIVVNARDVELVIKAVAGIDITIAEE